MSAPWKRLALIVSCVAVAGALSAARSRSGGVDASDPREIARLRAHFDSVLVELRSADVSALDAAQRSARATLIGRLEQYAAAGRFPHNHVRPGRTPVFRDEHGTLCAMAYLIASTGRTDIVDDVARGANLAFIPELASDARLRAWLDSTGLSVAEAARIQPGYDCCVIVPAPQARSDAPREYAVGSAFAAMASGAFIYLNAAPGDASRAVLRRTGWIGVAAGTAQTVYGALALPAHDSRRGVGAANVAIGAAALGTAIWRLRHLPAKPAPLASLGLGAYVAPREAGLVISARM